MILIPCTSGTGTRQRFEFVRATFVLNSGRKAVWPVRDALTSCLSLQVFSEGVVTVRIVGCITRMNEVDWGDHATPQH